MLQKLSIAHDRGITLQEHLSNRTIGDLVEQFANDGNHQWLNANDFFRGDIGDFTTIREVSESSHDIVMGESISADVSAMDIDGAEEQGSSQQSQAADQSAGATTSSSASGLSPKMLLPASWPLKMQECYQASDQMRGALGQLGEQLQQNMEAQLAEWVHPTEDYPQNLWLSRKACQRTGARTNMDGAKFSYHMQHANESIKVNLGGLAPYLDDYIVNARDSFVEDFVWSWMTTAH